MSDAKVNPKRVITPEARLSYPYLFQPAKPLSADQDPKYQCELIFPEGADLGPLKAAATLAARDKWGNNVPKNLKSPFRPGTDRDGKDGYEGCQCFMGARTKDKPGVVVGPERQPCLDNSEVYGGCYVRVSVTAFAYDAGVNKGVAFALNNVWKVRDGESFSGRVSAEDEFGDVDQDSFGGETTSSLL